MIKILSFEEGRIEKEIIPNSLCIVNIIKKAKKRNYGFLQDEEIFLISSAKWGLI